MFNHINEHREEEGRRSSGRSSGLPCMQPATADLVLMSKCVELDVPTTGSPAEAGAAGPAH